MSDSVQPISMAGQKRYALLASAIVGHSIATGVSKLAVVHTDGQTVYLPQGDDENHLVALVAQAAILRCGGFERKSVVKLVGRERVAARYLTLEAIRAAHAVGTTMPRWIQTRIAASWNGAVSASAEESLIRASAERSIAERPELFGLIRPVSLLKAQGLSGGGGSPIGERERLQAEQNASQERDEDDEGDDDENENTQRSTILSKMAGPLPESPVSRFLKNLFGAKRSPSETGDQGGGVEMMGNSVKWMKKIGAGAKIIATALRPGEWNASPNVGTAYPEWNHDSQSYMPNWCQVAHYEAAVTRQLDAGVPDRMLRRRLARLGTTYVRHHGQADGEDLDENALIRFLVDQASGYSGDEKVYETRRKTGRDLSAIVLLDASGSTGDQQANGASIWELQRTLAQDIVAALDDLGDIVAAYGFRSFGRNDVRFLRIKEFGERFSQDARSRLHSLNPSGYTRMGGAIRHATHLLSSKAHSESQLLIVVSDGLPYDISYEDTYAEQDVRCALREAEERGVGCVCLSVGSPRKKDALDRVWGNVGHASLESPRDLNRYAEPLFGSALRRAAGGRRRKAAA
ncbi:VWA domain-containing protein [Hydrocarboniphaga sp.]|uniref:nitric oxide reductase activation protein NorD n=1 Tax=Hydrocarboniphaga sp. TaxID=2033016 RepID=UPI0026106102|nr:VWA domain-containing protein [Hydrocarboniphaga sp.]